MIGFYGHTPKEKSIVDKSCFSQWFPARTIYINNQVPTSEHAMMLFKADLFNDSETFNLILQAPTPRLAKHLGRQVANFDQAVWEEKALNAVIHFNLIKFAVNRELKEFIKSCPIDNPSFVECSPTDCVWGVGLSLQDNWQDKTKWRGKNLLGEALTVVQRILVEEDDNSEFYSYNFIPDLLEKM